MKRPHKRPRPAPPARVRGAGVNPRLHAQARQQLRTHYAAKYRTR